MKSRNLTQISLQNDPINRRMQGFSFRIDEDKNWSSRCDFFLLLQSKFDFKHSIESEMSQEHYETSSTQIEALHKENLMKNCEYLFLSRRTVFIKTEINLSRPMKCPLRLTVAITRRLIETLCVTVIIRSWLCG